MQEETSRLVREKVVVVVEGLPERGEVGNRGEWVDGGRLSAMAVDIDLGMRAGKSGVVSTSGVLCNWVRDGQPGGDEWESRILELVRGEAA